MRKSVRIPIPVIVCVSAVFSSTVLFGASPIAALSAAQIIKRSAAANAADWKAQPQYAYREQTETAKLASNGEINSRQVKTYEVMMIESSPYERLIAANGKPLTRSQQQDEERKLKHEIQVRQSESASDRQARVAKYRKDRADERLLMQQMTAAFQFKLHGEEEVNGVKCYVLDAEPDPNYRPPVEKARVLTGMKGRLYIDAAKYHWVKVEAEVISPVDFGFIIAKVKPGTKFELVQAPVGNVWLPKQFAQTVNASVLGFYGMRSREKDTYSDYHREQLRAGIQIPDE